MEHRSLALGAGLILALLAPAAMAAEPALDAKRERVRQLERDARALRAEATRLFRDEEAVCRQRFLVNDCIKDAKERRLQKVESARRMESEQAALEREIRYAELAARREARLRKRAEEGPPPAVVSLPDRPPLEAAPLQ